MFQIDLVLIFRLVLFQFGALATTVRPPYSSLRLITGFPPVFIIFGIDAINEYPCQYKKDKTENPGKAAQP